MLLEHSKNIFFVGIKGAAMANLATILKKMGKHVTGSDVDEEFITDDLLRENKIAYSIGFSQKNLPANTDIVVYSGAHQGRKNPQVVEAKKKGLTVLSQPELLEEIMKPFGHKIAISGCHGKTTTASLLVYALNKLKAKPSYVVGVPYFTGHQGSSYEGKKYFVVEADEYGIDPPRDFTPKFHKLTLDYIINTNIDFDHPDVYKNIEETKQAFLKFFGKRRLILCADDKNTMALRKKLNKEQYVTYGFSEKADYRISKYKIGKDFSTFTIKDFGEYKISIFGKMNISNATAVVVMLIKLGYKPKEIAKALEGFIGSRRRFEKVYQKNNVYLFDDYAHHPTEITATIKAARERFKKRRLIVVFQPHTYSRTASLLREFAKALSFADYCLFLPIFASAREISSNFKISINDIIKSSPHKNLYGFHNIYELFHKLEDIIREGDIIFTMGAGNVYKLREEIKKIIDHGAWNVSRNVNLFQYLTLRTNVIAEYFIDAKSREDLIRAKQFSVDKKLPIFIFGGGSNVAIVTKKIYGLVIKNNYVDMKVLDKMKDYWDISVSSGYPVSMLINKTINMGLSGFEYHKGLPGTVGGAIAMNSKWTKPWCYFSDCLLYAYLVDNKGRVKKVDREYFKFAYDYSTLKDTREFVLEAVFRLKKENKKLLAKRADESLKYRLKTQPLGVPSSGCFFKNISIEEKLKKNLPTTSAGYLIDQCGLKAYKCGGFCISEVHANFIINKNRGKREDLIRLIKLIKTKVKKKFDIDLEEEVIIV